MPGFDRPITISWGGSLAPTVIKVWAAAFDTGSSFTPNGTPVYRRNYNIRFRQDVLDQHPARIRLIDEEGNLWTVESIQDTPQRRRMLFIQCQREGNPN